MEKKICSQGCGEVLLFRDACEKRRFEILKNFKSKETSFEWLKPRRCFLLNITYSIYLSILSRIYVLFYLLDIFSRSFASDKC